MSKDILIEHSDAEGNLSIFIQSEKIIPRQQSLASTEGESLHPHSEKKDTQLRLRCSKAERKRWNDFAQKVTGEPNCLSHLLRALLSLVEHAEPELMHELVQIQSLPLPQKSDSAAVAQYEESLARIIGDAIVRARQN